MRSTTVLAATLLVTFLLALSCGYVSAQSSSQQTPHRASTAQSPALTPQEKEAQKHYRIALEAIKYNDFSTASDELKAAADLAPENALIWYNLAVVESKKDDSTAALEHLQRAESLGLPKSLQDAADDLDAKLEYVAKRDAKKQAFSAKVLELQREINSGATVGDRCAQDFTNTFKDELIVQATSGTNLVLRFTRTGHSRCSACRAFPNSWWDDATTADSKIDVANFSPDVKVAGPKNRSCRWDSEDESIATYDYYEVAATLMSGKSFYVDGNSHWVDNSGTKDNPIHQEVTGCCLTIDFPSKDLADAASKTLSDLIRISAGTQ